MDIGRLRRGLAIGASVALLFAGLAVATSARGATAGTVVWTENFQTQDVSSGNAATSLAGFGYSAGDTWQAGQGNCNGWVFNFNSASPGDGCDGGGGVDANGTAHTAMWYGQRMTTVLGMMQGMTGAPGTADDPATNSAVVSLTNGGATSPQSAGTQFEADDVVQAVAGHSYAVAAYFTEVHCPGDPKATAAWTAASETMYLTVDGVPQAAAGDGTLAGGVSVCADPSSTTMTPTVATTGVAGWGGVVFHNLYLVSNPILVTSDAQLGLQIFDAQDQSVGNDLAFDSPQIIDVTDVMPPPPTPTPTPTPPTPNPSLLLTQAADPPVVTGTADAVSYQFAVTNTGNVDISSIGIYEAPASAGNTGTGTLSAITCPQTTLAAGESTTCTASYSPSQADIGAGRWTNVALAMGLANGAASPTLSNVSTMQVNVTGTGDGTDGNGGGQGGNGDGAGGSGGQDGQGGGGAQGGGDEGGTGQGGTSAGQAGTSGDGSSSPGQGGSSAQNAGFHVWVETGGVPASPSPTGGGQAEMRTGVVLGVTDRRRGDDDGAARAD